MSLIKHKLHTLIFEAETKSGRIFDLFLIGAILASLGVVVLESVASVRESWGKELLFWSMYSRFYLALNTFCEFMRSQNL